MNHLVVFAHPNPESLNRAILDTTVHALKQKGHDVVVRDLYDIDFQPVLKPQDIVALRDGQTAEDIKTEQGYIAKADAITFIYPIWWVGMPAILKGYVDRVFSNGFAFAPGPQGIEKLLTGKKGLIINTCGTPKEYYDQIGMTEGLKITADTGIFDFTGIEPVEHLIFGSVPGAGETAFEEILKQVEETVASIF